MKTNLPSFKSLIFVKFILIFFFLLAGFKNVHASHLVGGNIGYEYVGPSPFNPNVIEYKIYLDAYLDANSQFWGTGFPNPTINIGIYEGGLNPTSALNYTADINLLLIDSNQVDANLPPICDPFNLLSTVNVYLVRYEATVFLPLNSNGFWVVYDRCCRPGGMVNLFSSGDQSFAYTTWIPAQNGTLLVNSSAQFSDTLLSYICRTDTAYISNAATDSDGDSLAYELVTPFSGLTSVNAPTGQYQFPPLNPYPIPPPPITYETGYNLSNLLGTGSFSQVDPQSGLTRFLTNQTGYFVAAVEIKEYRNGNVVGVSRRNMQLISDDCPNNNAPNQNTGNLDPSAIDPLNYVVDAGDTVCFNLDYVDLDGDPLEFTASSSIFDVSITNPAATVNSPVFGVGSVSSTICWNTSCAQGSDTPYLINVNVQDSACPPLLLPQEVFIKVIPFEGPTQIFGDSVVCVTNDSSIFTTDTLPNVTYTWNITGGTPISTNGPEVIINWNTNFTTGVVEVTATNQNGCIATISRNVVLSNVITDGGSSPSICNGASVVLGGAPTTPNTTNTILWSPSTGLNNPTLPNPTASPTVTTTYMVSVENALGCSNTDTVIVTVNNTIPSGLTSNYFVCPGDTVQLNAIGATFNWAPNTFISNVNIANPKLYPPTTQQYFLNYFDVNGCEGNDTMLLEVNQTVPTSAGPDPTICLGDSVTLGDSPTSPPFTQYLWVPNSGMNDDTLANPTVAPIATTTYIVFTANDTCTGVDSVTVTVIPSPTLSLSGDTFVCINDSIPLFAFGTGTFLWSPGATLSDSTIANPLAFPTDTTTYIVSLTGANGCVTSDSLQLAVAPLPMVSAGGLINACIGAPVSLGDAPTGPMNSTYLWTPGNFLNFDQLPNPLAFLTEDQDFVVQVTDSNGCVNYDTASVKVFSATSSSDTSICADIPLQLNVNPVNGIAPFSFNWNNGSTLNDSTIANPTTISGNANNYQVIVTDMMGCIDTVNITLNIFTGSVANFTYDVTPSCSGIDVQITNTSEQANSYFWYLNGNLVSEAQDPNITLQYSSNSELMLVTESADGCLDTTITNIQGGSFQDLLKIDIANVFTPNGDGENDYFEILSNGDLSNCIHLTVYNRGGQIVFESSGGIHSWDGRSVTGQKYPDGVYFYIFEVNGMEFKGSVSLMR